MLANLLQNIACGETSPMPHERVTLHVCAAKDRHVDRMTRTRKAHLKACVAMICQCMLQCCPMIRHLTWQCVECSSRRFVVSCFMGDDTISVFEHRIDGFPGGKFLERGRVPRAGSKLGDYLGANDLFVGNRLSLHQHTFLLQRYSCPHVLLPSRFWTLELCYCFKRRPSVVLGVSNLVVIAA